MNNKQPFLAFRYTDFRLYTLANFFQTLAILIQELVISWELYRITKNPLALGFIGLAEAVPYICLALFGGYLADKYNKKKIIQWALLIILLSSSILYWVTLPETAQKFPQEQRFLIIYFVIFLVGTARGFYSPAIQSLRPNLVPQEAFANASTWHTSVWQAGVILGPTMGGFLYTWWGLSATLLLVIGFVAVDICLLSFIKTKPTINIESEENISIFTSFKEGFSFVYKNKLLFYSISLDLVSVFFGGVIAILPVFAVEVLHIGAEGLGILRASPSAGSFIALVLQAFYPPTKRAWRNMLIAIAGFGIFTLVFALSQNFWLSCFALFLTGAFDAVSMVVRRTIVDVMTPENLRGRVNAVNGIFVSSSNELGAFESGVAAKLFGTVPSILIGASCTLATVGIVWFKSKSLLDVDLSNTQKQD